MTSGGCGVILTSMNEFIFTVGGPGSGKSYVAKQLFPSLPIVDSDEIKKEYADYNPALPQLVHERSSQEATRRVLSFLSRGESVVFDGTGTNPEKLAGFISVARQVGMRVRALFVTCDVATAKARAEKRERKVPMAIVEEKHAAVAGAWLVVRAMADVAQVVDNS